MNYQQNDYRYQQNQYSGYNYPQQYQYNGWQQMPPYNAGYYNYNNYYNPQLEAEREALRKKKNSGFLAGNLTGLMIVGFMAVSFVLSFVLVLLDRNILNNEIAYWAANVIIAIPALIVPFLFLSIYAKKTDNKFNMFPSKKISPSVFILGTAIGVCVTYLGQYVSTYLQLILEGLGMRYNYSSSSLPSSPFAMVLYVISVVIIPPLCEEFAIRGVLLSYLRRFGDGFAIVVSALVFAILHMNMVQAPFAFIMGIYAAYITIYTGSIWIAVTVHFLINGMSTLYQICETFMNQEALGIAFGMYVLAVIAIGIISFVIMKMMHKGFCRLKRTDEITRRSHARGFFFLSPVLIITIIYFIISSFVSI